MDVAIIIFGGQNVLNIQKYDLHGRKYSLDFPHGSSCVIFLKAVLLYRNFSFCKIA